MAQVQKIIACLCQSSRGSNGRVWDTGDSERDKIAASKTDYFMILTFSHSLQSHISVYLSKYVFPVKSKDEMISNTTEWGQKNISRRWEIWRQWLRWQCIHANQHSSQQCRHLIANTLFLDVLAASSGVWKTITPLIRTRQDLTSRFPSGLTKQDWRFVALGHKNVKPPARELDG